MSIIEFLYFFTLRVLVTLWGERSPPAGPAPQGHDDTPGLAAPRPARTPLELEHAAKRREVFRYPHPQEILSPGLTLTPATLGDKRLRPRRF